MKTKILELNNEKTIFWSLIAILFVCATFYIYCINVTIRNVVTRQNIETESAQLSLSIGNKEFTYISMRNAITLPLAYSLGFHDVSEKTFISKRSVSYVSYLTHEI